MRLLKLKNPNKAGTPPNEMQIQWRLESAQWNVYMKMQNKPESDAVMKMQNQLML
jgi:hypothetical protein